MLVGGFPPDLGLAGSDEIFFFPEVDFNPPSPEVVLQKFREGEIRICAEEIGGLAVEQLPAFGQAVAEGGDDDDSQREVGSAFSPQDRPEGFDFKVMVGTGGEGSDFFPRVVVVLAEFLGSRGFGSVAAGASGFPCDVGRGFYGFGRMVQNHVFASASDVDGVFGKASQDGFVGEAAVAVEDEATGGGNFPAQVFDTLQADGVEVLLFERFAVVFLLVVGRVLVGFGRTGGVLEVDWDHAGFAVSSGQGPGGAELEVALGSYEVGLERGSEGIALPADAVNFRAGLAYDGVVEGDNEGLAGRKVF